MQQHHPSVKGLAGCGLNLLMPVGTNFNISFYVLDNNQPPAMANINRTVHISEPCPNPDGSQSPLNFCADNTGG